MTRAQLEHIIRASAGITGASELVIIGFQSVLGQFPDAPRELLVSMEADVFTFRDPHDAELIDGSIGEGSPFHSTFGYFAHGVGVETAVLPDGWRSRLVRVQTPSTNHAIGLCLEAHDLAISKIVAGREKDLEFVRALLSHRCVDASTLRERLASCRLNAELQQACEYRLQRVSAFR